jgi:hypothetical protein
MGGQWLPSVVGVYILGFWYTPRTSQLPSDGWVYRFFIDLG